MAEGTLIGEAWGGLLDLVFPPKCLLCGAYGSVDVCAECRTGFAAIEPPICERCGVATDGMVDLCADCSDGPGWSFVRARAAGHFSGTLRRAILRLKYGDKRRLAVPLGVYLGQYLMANPMPVDFVVPVPLHRSRLRDRGFNQSELIAREVGRILSAPVATNVLARTRRTRPQAELHAGERASNVRDAFAALESPLVRRKRILLIDDVLTTVKTANHRVKCIVSLLV